MVNYYSQMAGVAGRPGASALKGVVWASGAGRGTAQGPLAGTSTSPRRGFVIHSLAGQGFKDRR